MRESVTYQDILEEGRIEGVTIGVKQGLVIRMEQGRVEGQIEGERLMLLRLATRKFGQPAGAVRAQIEAISDPDTVEQLADRVLTATTWDELLEGVI